ncbi:PDZ domain-containing protein [Pontibacillus yanchengensis]|uniref:PDZ domain-containing protein n=1 Tax=Pontibacillus yanchengensis TaxID=462910 RepID=A0ACC7VIT0_9BACI|nr:PDZ domain-containing protein [Pontibacillus yanchengensis]MYL54044.1 PDZ domain-containing protein [Pontibacillus yanchengensis]
MESWLLEVAKGIGRLFLHPLFYWAICLTFLASIARIKRERRDFGIKLFNIFSEWKGTWGTSLLAGLILSIITISSGIVFPYAMVLLWTAIVILVTIMKRFSWLSAAYTASITFLVFLFLPEDTLSFLPTSWVDGLNQASIIFMPILIGTLLIVEAVLMKRQHSNSSFPQYIKGSRGKIIGQHRVKKLALIPAFFLIPGGAIEPFAPWWPTFSIGGGSFGLMLVPLLIGYELVIKGISPKRAASQLGNYLIVLSFIVIGLGIGGMYVPMLSLIGVVVAFLGREVSAFIVKWKDQGHNPYFTPRHDGLPVLGVIPHSTADKMGLLVGERIEKVNNYHVSNEEEFHKALQSNGAYCKIEVRDTNGEIRFAQRAMYEGDHYELGLVFVKDRHRKEDSKGMKVSQ